LEAGKEVWFKMKVHDFYRQNNLRVHEIPKGTKCPVAKDWPNAKKTPDEVESLLDGVNFDKYGWLLDDNHVVVDIDLHNEQENGFDSLAKLETDIGFKLEDVCGAIVDTPSGGRHYYFSKPSGEKFGKVFKDKYPGIDFINGKGKQVVAANSCHDRHPGVTYRINDNPHLIEMPSLLLTHLQEQKKDRPKTEPTQTAMGCERAGDEFNKSSRGLQIVLGELAARGYAVRQVGGYYEFDRPGKSTESKCSGHVGKYSKQGNLQLTCFSLSDPLFASGEAMTLFYAYASLCHAGDLSQAAMALYGLGFAVEEYVDVNLSFLMRKQVDVKARAEEDKPKRKTRRPALSDDLLQPAGVLGEMVRFVISTSRFEHPELALASVLAFSGMVLGRRVRAIDDTRPNIYCLSIAESGTGKNHARQVVKRIMAKAGISIPPEGSASATGLVRTLALEPSIVVQMDEAGLQFRAMKNPRSPQAELGQQFSELFTGSNGFYAYRAYADTKNQARIDQPHLSINAITTENSLYSGGFNHDDIEQGLFGRFLLFRPKVMDPPEKFDIEVPDVPESIVSAVKSWWEYQPWDVVAGANLEPDHPEPMVIPFSEAAKARYRAYAIDVSDKLQGEDTFTKALWRRSKEKAARLALIHACMKGGKREGIVIEKDSMDWGVAISNYSTRGMVYDMHNSIVESDYQDKTKYFLGKIPSEGIEWWELSRKLRRLSRKERMDVLTDLCEMGMVEIQEVKTTGLPKKIVRPI